MKPNTFREPTSLRFNNLGLVNAIMNLLTSKSAVLVFAFLEILTLKLGFPDRKYLL